MRCSLSENVGNEKKNEKHNNRIIKIHYFELNSIFLFFFYSI
jgi:hypothetical protein